MDGVKILLQAGVYCSLAILAMAQAPSRTCESLSFRTGVDISCEHPVTKESLDCQRIRMPTGTIARYGCEEFFVTNDGETEGGEMVCGQNGKWKPDLRFRSFSCHTDCGKSYSDSPHTFWPWHAGVFARDTDSSSAQFQFACGATLINPFNADEPLVLTGAECVRNKVPADIQIRLGLFSQEETTRNKHTGQIISARKIVIEGDGLLALIQLTRQPALSKSILPACLSLSVNFARHQLQESNFGQLVGFGDRSKSDALRNISVGITTLGNCLEKRSGVVSKHSFCAGGIEGRNICNGDVGSALLFPRFSANSERHFVLGVLVESVPQCKSHNWFIGLSDYADWIKQTALDFHEGRSTNHGALEVKPKLLSTVPSEIQLPRTTPPPPRPLTRKVQPVRPITSQIRTRNEQQHEIVSLPIPIRNIVQGIIRSENPDLITIERGEDNFAFSNSIKDYEVTAVLDHNNLRRRHGSPPVKISHHLSQLAQVEADRALATNRFKFQGYTNWYGTTGKTVPFSALVHDAVRDWYKTSVNYNWAIPRSSPFTQIVWRSTRAIGIGVGQRGTKQIVVVKYARPGVISSEREQSMRENVLPTTII